MKMKIALHDSDRTKFPNLALMKLSAWHKSKGDSVEFYSPLFSSEYNKIYSSKVFTYTKEENFFGSVEKGGTGYKKFNSLSDKIEHTCPDYGLYNLDYSLGFLTRGCPNKCSWCIVPKKEGNITAHADIEEFLKHKKVVLMDNNVLSSEHGIQQIEKLIELQVKVDFNQGLDSRLIDNSMAKLLSKLKWLSPIRLACDRQSQMKSILKAVTFLRWNNATPSTYFVYCLVKEIEEALERVKFLKGLHLDPFAQPYIDYNGGKITREQKDFSRWVNHKAIFKTVPWDEYKKGKRKEKIKMKLIPRMKQVNLDSEF